MSEDAATQAGSSNKWIVAAVVAAICVAGLGYSVTRTTSPSKPKAIKRNDEKPADVTDDVAPPLASVPEADEKTESTATPVVPTSPKITAEVRVFYEFVDNV